MKLSARLSLHSCPLRLPHPGIVTHRRSPTVGRHTAACRAWPWPLCEVKLSLRHVMTWHDAWQRVLGLYASSPSVTQWCASAAIFALCWPVLWGVVGSEAYPGSHLFALWVAYGCAVVCGALAQRARLPPLLGMLLVRAWLPWCMRARTCLPLPSRASRRSALRSGTFQWWELGRTFIQLGRPRCARSRPASFCSARGWG